MGRHEKNLSRPPKAGYSDYLSQKATVFTQYTTASFVTVQPISPPDLSNDSETLVNEYRYSASILDEEKLNLATVKNNAANCGILQPSLEGKPDVMSVSLVYQVRYS